MDRGGGVHTVPAPGWWNVRDGKVLSKHRRKSEAVEAGRVIAQQLEEEHTIHNADGVIGEKNSYGNDPIPPKDGG